MNDVATLSSLLIGNGRHKFTTTGRAGVMVLIVIITTPDASIISLLLFFVGPDQSFDRIQESHEGDRKEQDITICFPAAQMNRSIR